ncbi:pyridoxamine 5'-phosphate oxidase family protein [Agreia sp. Leaf210]|uniref:pyridoxamine 5'-phosphate oxidase family protein n=1 Tax=Agreia sp. Leaf210 TaxID=1735682 RepID=UPI0006F66A34|nr:pyridoxamine 5'-phosphate oxidase family protein [Agreia sp. Leaf210]KQM60713.1 hypothetical protein ASE64_03395 [Agreia sp. Leaf210]
MVMLAKDFQEWSPQGTVTELSVDHCWERLAGSNIGRLGLIIDNKPEIFPVNYIADGHTIVFRTAHGTKYESLTTGAPVVFEVDERLTHGGWSVVLKGPAVVLGPDIPESSPSDHHPPMWVAAAGYMYVRLTPQEIRGREFEGQVRIIYPNN